MDTLSLTHLVTRSIDAGTLKVYAEASHEGPSGARVREIWTEVTDDQGTAHQVRLTVNEGWGL